VAQANSCAVSVVSKSRPGGALSASAARGHHYRRAERHGLQRFVLDAHAVDHRTEHDLGSADVAAYIVNVARHGDARVARHVSNDFRRPAADDGQRGLGALPPDQGHDVPTEMEGGGDVGVIAHVARKDHVQEPPFLPQGAEVVQVRAEILVAAGRICAVQAAQVHHGLPVALGGDNNVGQHFQHAGLEARHGSHRWAGARAHAVFAEQADAVNGVPHERLRFEERPHRGDAAQVLHVYHVEGPLGAEPPDDPREARRTGVCHLQG